jgi:hypothetical protein
MIGRVSSEVKIATPSTSLRAASVAQVATRVGHPLPFCGVTKSKFLPVPWIGLPLPYNQKILYGCGS